MRISPEKKDDIIELVRKEISQQAQIWLFGSRVRDGARGGDIDLLIEVDGLSNPVEKKIHLRLALEDRWGEQKVDILIHNTQYPEQPIHRIAKLEGVRLV
ncbi:nucleotidyltransferase domain-containing protein [Endozoicomonas sp. 8E]|uniref:nucleotidyltransferase domain-containing protein n=1 Tax=Endozoicomonas sp. 8E TaxID=3035692 RepID=UPI002938F239|nr:nucleotidyltransferase domain-containing protein [Endozoicomonas sp. 8E]WOG27211.1 nucleotidyltransferase domain-containing protein [Endozoicomonas sp. 8E]